MDPSNLWAPEALRESNGGNGIIPELVDSLGAPPQIVMIFWWNGASPNETTQRLSKIQVCHGRSSTIFAANFHWSGISQSCLITGSYLWAMGVSKGWNQQLMRWSGRWCSTSTISLLRQWASARPWPTMPGHRGNSLCTSMANHGHRKKEEWSNTHGIQWIYIYIWINLNTGEHMWTTISFLPRMWTTSEIHPKTKPWFCIAWVLVTHGRVFIGRGIGLWTFPTVDYTVDVRL